MIIGVLGYHFQTQLDTGMDLTDFDHENFNSWVNWNYM